MRPAKFSRLRLKIRVNNTLLGLGGVYGGLLDSVYTNCVRKVESKAKTVKEGEDEVDYGVLLSET